MTDLSPEISAAELESRLLYRDAVMLVMNKPAGIPVHLAGSKKGDYFERYFDHLRFGLPRAPALAHRLDKDTSGCLILGRHIAALRLLGQLFTQGTIRKTYWALVHGGPQEAQGRIDIPLRKQSHRRDHWRMMAAASGEADAQEAITDYRVLGRHGDLCWLELMPLTGRTHQLRVHCAASGWAIIGDTVYGASLPNETQPHLQLHAREVTVPLFAKKPAITVTAPPPEHMAGLLSTIQE